MTLSHEEPICSATQNADEGSAGSDDSTGTAASPVQRIRGAASSEATECCWGAILQGFTGHCKPGFFGGTAHFKNKFCSACKAGMDVTSSRVRALTPALEEALNFRRSSSGFWKPSPPELGGGRIRIINNTAACRAPALVCYEEEPPELAWAEIPREWLSPCGTVIRLCIAQGTLRPVFCTISAHHLHLRNATSSHTAHKRTLALADSHRPAPALRWADLPQVGPTLPLPPWPMGVMAPVMAPHVGSPDKGEPPSRHRSSGGSLCSSREGGPYAAGELALELALSHATAISNQQSAISNQQSSIIHRAGELALSHATALPTSVASAAASPAATAFHSTRFEVDPPRGGSELLQPAFGLLVDGQQATTEGARLVSDADWEFEWEEADGGVGTVIDESALLNLLDQLDAVPDSLHGGLCKQMCKRTELPMAQARPIESWQPAVPIAVAIPIDAVPNPLGPFHSLPPSPPEHGEALRRPATPQKPAPQPMAEVPPSGMAQPDRHSMGTAYHTTGAACHDPLVSCHGIDTPAIDATACLTACALSVVVGALLRYLHLLSTVHNAKHSDAQANFLLLQILLVICMFGCAHA